MCVCVFLCLGVFTLAGLWLERRLVVAGGVCVCPAEGEVPGQRKLHCTVVHRTRIVATQQEEAFDLIGSLIGSL